MKITLISTSQDRFDYIKKFLASLKENLKLCPGVKVFYIFIDQSGGGFKFIKNYETDNLSIKIISSKKISLSRARNIGILNKSKSDVIAFPDDDCEYPIGLIHYVKYHFESSNNGICFLYPGKNKFRKKYIYSDDLIGNVISFSFFIPDNSLLFDEQLGVGNYFGAAEETEYLLRYIENNKYIETCSKFTIKHPDRTGTSLKRTRSYALGFGAISKIYFFRGGFKCKLISLRILFGPVIRLIKLNNLKNDFIDLSYRLRGFMLWKK